MKKEVKSIESYPVNESGTSINNSVDTEIAGHKVVINGYCEFIINGKSKSQCEKKAIKLFEEK